MIGFGLLALGISVSVWVSKITSGHEDVKVVIPPVKEVISEMKTADVIFDVLTLGEPEEVVSNVVFKEKELSLDKEISSVEISVDKEWKPIVLNNELSGVKVQIMNIDPSKSNVFRGKGGVEISVPKDAFLGGEIKLEMKEYLSRDEIVLSGLTTSSDGVPIESNGMIYLEAKNEKGELVEPSKLLVIRFPKNDLGEGF